MLYNSFIELQFIKKNQNSKPIFIFQHLLLRQMFPMKVSFCLILSVFAVFTRSQVRMLQPQQEALSILNFVVSYLSTIINFLRRVLVLSAMLFLIQNLINFWVLASSYYMVNINMPNFFKNQLSVLYNKYNITFLQYLDFNIPFPSPPSLGAIKCGVDVNFNSLSFGFEPILLILLMLIELSIVSWIVVKVKKGFRNKKYSRLSKIIFFLTQQSNKIAPIYKDKDNSKQSNKKLMLENIQERHWSENIHINRLENTASIFINYMTGLLVPAYGLLFESKVISFSGKLNLIGYYIMLSFVIFFPLGYFISIRTLKHSHIQTFFQYSINFFFSLALGYQCSALPFLIISTIILSAYLFHAIYYSLMKEQIKRFIFWLFNLMFIVMVVVQSWNINQNIVDWIGIISFGLFVLGGAVQLTEFCMTFLINTCKIIYMVYNICRQEDITEHIEKQHQQNQQSEKVVKQIIQKKQIIIITDLKKQQNSCYEMQLKRTLDVVKVLQLQKKSQQ